MRNIVIGLSILFFALSGIIIFKTSGIPVVKPRYENSLKELTSNDRSNESEDISEKLAKEQTANRALVEELQATVARLENKLLIKDTDVRTKIETGESQQKTIVLAVLGAGMFRSGQIVINENMISEIKKIVPDILAFPDYHVIIEGHTDNEPIRLLITKRYKDNMDLSFLRAKAVANILVDQNISLKRITVVGYGETRPIASNETAEDRAKNRRVEVKLITEDREL